MDKHSRSSSSVESFGLEIWSGRQSPDHNRPHRHNEIELNYVEHGAITYIYGGHEIRIAGRESAVFWGAVPHQLVYYEPGTVINIATVPLEDVLQWDLPQSFLARLLAGKLLRFGAELALPYEAAMYRQWRHDLDAGTAYVALLEIRALLHRCALLESRLAPVKSARLVETPSAETPPHKAQQMAQYISRHFQQPLTVQEVAGAVGLHPHYAMSIFKAVFHITMIEYLTQQRIAYAQQHLLMTDASPADIAYDAGFQTLSHFYHVFKRLCGLPPAKYRAALRQTR
jgi:AraC-like DNA-binding protein